MEGRIGRGTGPLQIIPTLGAHKQFYVTDAQVVVLVMANAIEYDPEYGPHANVFRPVGSVDAETVASWLT